MESGKNAGSSRKEVKNEKIPLVEWPEARINTGLLENSTRGMNLKNTQF